VVREGVGAGGEMNQALYAHMNNKRKRKKKERMRKKKFTEYKICNIIEFIACKLHLCEAL
jgi:hypothetical protein